MCAQVARAAGRFTLFHRQYSATFVMGMRQVFRVGRTGEPGRRGRWGWWLVLALVSLAALARVAQLAGGGSDEPALARPEAAALSGPPSIESPRPAVGPAANLELDAAARDAELAQLYAACPLSAVVDFRTVATSPEKAVALLPPFPPDG